LAGALTEQSIFATDPSGVLLKGRPDVIGADFMADLKTTGDASTGAFSRTIASYRYHVQAALYRRIMHLLGQPKARWYFIIVQLTPVPRVNVRELIQLAIAQGENDLEADLALLRHCQATGRWPGLSGDEDGICGVDIPPWAYTDAAVGDVGALEEMKGGDL
jgi:exodeoxyribonuclease VIII